MDYDNNYIEVAYNPEELNEIFIKEFIILVAKVSESIYIT